MKYGLKLTGISRLLPLSMKRHFVIICLILIALPKAIAQNNGSNCSQVLIAAERAYQEGEFLKVEQLLQTCLKSYKGSEAIEAYRLMVLTYLFSDQPEEADEYYKRLLDIDPNYVPNLATDPIELYTLHQGFRTAPLFTFGIMAGGNISRAMIDTQNQEIYRLDGGNPISRRSLFQFGVQFSVGGEWYFKPHMSLLGHFTYKTSQIKFTESIFISDQLTFVESQQWFSFPLSVRYYLGNTNKTRFFVEAGGGLSLLRKASAEVERTVTDEKDVSGPEIDVLSLRNTTNYSASVGFGLRKSLGQLMFYTKFDVTYHVNHQNNPDTRYSNTELMFQYGYVDQDFRVISPSVSVGLSYAIYNHKRKIARVGK